MSTASNLYAEKVFSEHPIALWALDDKADYISVITEEQRRLANWQVTGATVSQAISDESPFQDSVTNRLSVTVDETGLGQIVCISEDIVNFSDLNGSLKTFAIGGYFYSFTPAISSFELGYEYYDVTNGSTVQHLKSFDAPINNNWIFLSETFDIPDDNTTLRVVVKINYFSSVMIEDVYKFLVHGISVGQWSEEFNSTSLGVHELELPAGIFSSGTHYGVKAVAYGLEENPGYYLSSGKSLVAKNTGIPMVYGATGITKLLPNGDSPSLVLPGKGFLHEEGKYNNYTFEGWVRIVNDSTTHKKIFGPLGGLDGLWVDGPFMTLRISNHFATAYVGEWGKPMLLNIVYGATGANLLINGEQVASLSFNSDDLFFAENESDWLGFWCNEDVSAIELDAVAIYSYQVPSILAKRRFVYGQGVDFPENINTSYSGSSVFIDYQYADYTNNYVYPDLGNWNQGSRNNLAINENMLSAPDYQLPTLVLESGDSSELSSVVFTDATQSEDSTFFTFKPNSSLVKNGYLLFDNLNFLQEEVKAFYSLIKINEAPVEEQVILHIESESTNSYLSIVVNGRTIDYKFFHNGILSTIYSTTDYALGEKFPVGINIDDFSSYFGGDLLSFFGNRTGLKFYVAGTKEFASSFKGNIYNVGFSNAANLNEIKELFNARGCVLEYEDVFNAYTSQIDYDAGEYTGSDLSFWQFFLDGGSPTEYSSYRLSDHTASYTLIVKNYFNNYYFDIGVKSSWKDYLPLTYFAESVQDTSGNSYYDLDFIQFNIDYPAPSAYAEVPSDPVSWKYGIDTVLESGEIIPSLSDQFSDPVKRTYASLDNQLFTGYNNYDDLKNRSSKNYIYDTSNSYVRSYVTFEYTESGLNSSDLYFSSSVGASRDGVVTPGAEWMTTKYEVVDGMIIYPPAEDLSSLSLVTRLDFKIDGIITHSIKLKTLEYSSESFNDSIPNPVGTKFGTPIYPYRKSGYYYNYKNKNPFSIYKKSTPYLYLTRNSGITLKGAYDPTVDRGLAIPINPTLAKNYRVMAMQAALRFDQDFFPYAPTQIFEIESPEQHIKFFMVANSSDGNRARIYAVNAKTGQLDSGISFYWNGKLVREPVMTIREWGFLGISFSNILDFTSSQGLIKITGPLTFNTISYYQTTTLQEVQQITNRPWFKVLYAGTSELDWQFWNIPQYDWGNIMVISTKSYYGVDPETIYKSYTGTNKIIVGSDNTFSLGNYEYNFYQDATWQQSTTYAV
jgi:hypothetical protein